MFAFPPCVCVRAANGTAAVAPNASDEFTSPHACHPAAWVPTTAGSHMLMVLHPHKKNSHDSLSLETLVSTIAAPRCSRNSALRSSRGRLGCDPGDGKGDPRADGSARGHRTAAAYEQVGRLRLPRMRLAPIVRRGRRSNFARTATRPSPGKRPQNGRRRRSSRRTLSGSFSIGATMRWRMRVACDESKKLTKAPHATALRAGATSRSAAVCLRR
jgi:hypothetical protein